MPLDQNNNLYRQTQQIRFDVNGIPLCPNGCGNMDLVRAEAPVGVNVVPEARARCRVCRHTMIVADERPLLVRF